MQKKEIILLSVSLIFVFLIVYSPHFAYHFPFHIDEWHDITEAKKIGAGEYQRIGRTESGVSMGFQIGFHVFLFLLSLFLNLVSFYQFFPAIWAVLSALLLFFIVKKKTGNFYIALFSVLFFASIKTNVNILGIQFFTPLTFSFPFIFLYIYLFTEGMEKKNKKYILASLAIMSLLVFTYVFAITFSLIFMLIYCFMHRSYIIKEWRFFSLFLIIPILGIIFYSFMNNQTISHSIFRVISDFQFKKGWNILETNNSILEVYSLIGYILALIGTSLIFYRKEKSLMPYALLPTMVLGMILFFKLFDISYFSPFQRNLHLMAIFLPMLSAIGLFSILKKINLHNKKMNISVKLIILLILFSLTFLNYYSVPKGLGLYKTVTEKDIPALTFLRNQPEGIVMTDIYLAEALYPIANKHPVATDYFDGNRSEVINFFTAPNCSSANKVLARNNVTYIVSKRALACNWQLIFKDVNFIYRSNLQQPAQSP